MPNCDFYAAGPDHRAVIEIVLTQGRCDVYKSGGTRPFRTFEELEEHYGVKDWQERVAEDVYLELYVHGSGGQLILEQRVQGWGLIQLQLEGVRKGRLFDSHTNHNTENRATRFHEAAYKELGPPDKWNWDVVTSFSRRLNRAIRRLAVAKRDSRGILPFAATLPKKGISIG